MNASELRKSATQFLRALQQAGLTDLPSQSVTKLGKLIFESESTAAGSPSGSRSSAAEVVTERPSQYQTESGRPDSDALPASASANTKAAASKTDLFRIDEAYGPSKCEGDRASALQLLSQQVASCTVCPQLAACRKNTVFGVGKVTPRLALYGEAPGADEDRLGEPFVGRAGDLLNKILSACHLRREDVYIFNTVKCRPPNNRNPHDAEIENCWNYSEQQLEILQPEFIVCLGSVAARTLLKTKESVGRLRGKFHKYRGSQVVVTYHPAYLLRTPNAKAKTWEDMQMLMGSMGVES